MRKCEWHCGDLRCGKIASVVDIENRGFCQDHADGHADGDYRIPLDGEILEHLLREEIARDFGKGETGKLDGFGNVLARVAERWNKGDL
jgi:hypothetical protein